MAETYDWLDLSARENQVYLINIANNYARDLEKARETYQKCKEQGAYIETLEKQVRLLQKTLDVINQNKAIVRKVRKRGRSPMDKVLYRYVHESQDKKIAPPSRWR